MTRSGLVLAAALLVACLSGVCLAAASQTPPPGAAGPKADAQRSAIQTQADALAAKGPDGVKELAAKLRDGDVEWQAAALEALGHLGPDAAPALDAAVAALGSKDLRVKRMAAVVLKGIGSPAKSAVPALIEAARETRDLNGLISPPGSYSTVADAAVDAVRAIDPDATPRLAEAIIPGLLKVVEKDGGGPCTSALGILARLGPEAKPALPRLRELLPSLQPFSVEECLRVFLANGEDGMAMLADFIADLKTGRDVKVSLMRGYRWERKSTPSTQRILRALLDDDDPIVRAAAVDVLETVQAKELVPAHALGNQGQAAVPALTKALESKAPLARFQAARALAHIGKDSHEAAPALEKLLDDRNPAVQVEAAKALILSGSEGDKALKKLDESLNGKPPLPAIALEAVVELKRAGLPLLAAVKRTTLEADAAPVQHEGLRALQAMRADPPEIVQVWATLVQNDPSFLTFPPAEEIRAHGKEAQAALPAVLKYLKNPDVNVRYQATGVLAAMGPAAREAIPDLVRALDDDSFVANGAAAALGAMGPAAKPAVGALLRKFAAIKPDDREASYDKKTVLTALEQIGPGAAEAVPRLIEWLPAYPQAARTLGAVGPDAKEAVPDLKKMYGEQTGYARAWSAFALVKITGQAEPYVPTLAETFEKEKNPERRFEALEALVELGPDARAALPTLIAATKEKGRASFASHEFRHEAAVALVHFGPDAKEAVPALIDMLATSYFAGKVAAAEALGAIGSDAKEAVPARRRGRPNQSAPADLPRN